MISKERLDEIIELAKCTCDGGEEEAGEMAQELSELRKLVVDSWQRYVDDIVYCAYCDDYMKKEIHSPECPVLRYAEYREERK